MAILGFVRGIPLTLEQQLDHFKTLKLGDQEIDEDNDIDSIFFNDDWIHYTWYTAYDKAKESVLVHVDDFLREQSEKDNVTIFRGRWLPRELPYTVDMLKSVITYGGICYTFEEMYENENKNLLQ